MKSQLNYNVINVLNQLAASREALEQYLAITSDMLKHTYPDYPYAMDFNIDEEKYVISQQGKNFVIETGFFWEPKDLYFGLKIIVPYAIDSLEKVPFDANWSYCIEGDKHSYTQLHRYSDMMVVGCASKEYIEVLHKFSKIVEASKEVVEIAKKFSDVK